MGVLPQQSEALLNYKLNGALVCLDTGELLRSERLPQAAGKQGRLEWLVLCDAIQEIHECGHHGYFRKCHQITTCQDYITLEVETYSQPAASTFSPIASQQ